MLRSQFEEDLEKLHNQFYAMGQEVLSQINRTVRAFVTHDRDLAKEVIEEDAEVNGYEVKLEKKSFEMIALQQPVSQDLRTVLTVLKAVSDPTHGRPCSVNRKSNYSYEGGTTHSRS